MNVPRDLWKRIRKYPNVVGYSGSLQPRIRGGVVVPDEKCIRVYVKKKLPAIQLKPAHRIPSEIDGIPVDVVEVGEIRALSSPPDRTKKYRPLVGGISIGHYLITAGTLGWFAKDNTDGEIVMVSNNHVFANENKGKKGDPILQPGPYDGGVYPVDLAGRLKRFVKISFDEYNCPYRNTLYKLMKPFVSTENTVDVAIASLAQPQDEYEILEVGAPVDKLYDVQVGMSVIKSGRTTGLTQGTIVDTQYNGEVEYSRGTAFFVDQILVQGTGFSQGGDSGSLVLTTDKKIVGLLFAGSDNYTVVNKLKNVEEEIGISMLVSK
jgi:hypothetical protein